MPSGGARLGRYLVERELATGGMATIFLGKAVGPAGFEKPVVIKRIHPSLASEPQFISMLLDEARIVARIHHPNVVQMYDLGEHEGSYFLVMEHVEGVSLAEVARRTVELVDETQAPAPLSIAVAAHIVAEAAAGLHAAHEQRGPDGSLMEIVHRDISPGNILISHDGIVKIADFGVAKARGRLTRTEAKQAKGKIAYMAPEQILCSGVDRRSDIFSLGVVLWEVTCLQRLFKHPTPMETVEQIIKGSVPRPTELVPGYPPVLERIVLRALQKRPADRFQTAEEMRLELKQSIRSAGRTDGTLEIAKVLRQLFDGRAASGEARKGAPAPVVLRGEKGRALAQSMEIDLSSLVGTELGQGEASAAEAGPDGADEGEQGSVELVSGKLVRWEPQPGSVSRPARRRRGGVMVLALGVAVALAALAFFAAGRERGSAGAGPVEGHQPAGPPRRIEVTLLSEPPGAEVTRGDRDILGVTPLTIVSDVRRAPVAFAFRLSGYRPVVRTVTLTRDTQLLVTLVEESHAAGAALSEDGGAKKPRTLERGGTIDPFSP